MIARDTLMQFSVSDKGDGRPEMIWSHGPLEICIKGPFEPHDRSSDRTWEHVCAGRRTR